MEKKPSELFEGENSSFRKTYDEAVTPTVVSNEPMTTTNNEEEMKLHAKSCIEYFKHGNCRHYSHQNK